MSISKLNKLIKTKEFIQAFNKFYPNGADMTMIRIKKVLRKEIGLQILIVKR